MANKTQEPNNRYATDGQFLPRIYQVYYYLNSSGGISDKKWIADSADMFRLNIANVFESMEEAIEFELGCQPRCDLDHVSEK